MQFDSKKREKATVVTVSGRLDPITGPFFEERFARLVKEGERTFVLDLSNLEYISSAGLRSILAMAKKLTPLEGVMVFAGLKGMVKDVFNISGFGAMFAIHPTTEDALKALQPK